MHRGVAKMPIYRDDDDRRAFLGQLAGVIDRCRLECYAYCLMTNHYHLVVRTIDANLSSAMQQLNAPYAQSWNERHAPVGDVLQGRFAAQIIQDARHRRGVRA